MQSSELIWIVLQLTWKVMELVWKAMLLNWKSYVTRVADLCDLGWKAM